MAKYKVKVWYPTGAKDLVVSSMAQLINKLRGYNYTTSDQNVPKGYDWVVKNMSQNRNSCDC